MLKTWVSEVLIGSIIGLFKTLLQYISDVIHARKKIKADETVKENANLSDEEAIKRLRENYSRD